MFPFSSLFSIYFLSCYFSHLFFLTLSNCLLLFLSLFFLASCLLWIAKAFLYCLLWWVLLFYSLTTFGLMWVSFPDHPLVCWLPSHHSYPMLAVPHSIPRQKSFVLFFYSPWHSHPDKDWVFSLTNSYGMYLVIPIHISFFWVVCHPSRIFPPKELEQESHNRLLPSSHHQTIYSLTSDPWPTAPILTEYKWVVPKSCACSTFMWVHGLPIVHVFAMARGFVWSLMNILLLVFNLFVVWMSH